jgi:hypothetical protein
MEILAAFLSGEASKDFMARWRGRILQHRSLSLPLKPKIPFALNNATT